MNPKLPVCAVLVGALAVFQPYRLFVVSGDSMDPTFHTGEVLFGNVRSQRIARGDVVVFRHEGETMIKRVAMLPGDRVEAFRFRGEWQTLLSAQSRESMLRRGFPRREDTVPAGRFYALGDNRYESVDSRSYGTVPLDDVLAVLPPRPRVEPPNFGFGVDSRLARR